MTREDLVLILLGVLGVFFHCFAKMKTLNDAAMSANLKDWTWKTYVRKDYIAIILSFLSVWIWYLCFAEVGTKYPVVIDFKRVSFVLAGIVGSFIIQFGADTFLNSAKKSIAKYVDIKTNISDIVTGQTKSVQEIIDKGTEATGKDVTIAPVEKKE